MPDGWELMNGLMDAASVCVLKAVSIIQINGISIVADRRIRTI